MDAVAIRRDLDYGPPARLMDLYDPARETDHGPWPVVVIVAGYSGAVESRRTALTYKEIGWTISMCQLIALSGMVAIAYTNRDPVADLQALLEHVHERASTLRIDPTRVGVLAVSGNARGLRANLPITFVNYPEGVHAFDLFDDSQTSRNILRQTLQFLRQHLMEERADARLPTMTPCDPQELRSTVVRRQSVLRDVLARMFCEHFVDERLIADAAATRLLAKRLEDVRIDANGNQLTRFFPERRPTHTAHGCQLLRRRVRNIREVNPSPCTTYARGGSPAAR